MWYEYQENNSGGVFTAKAAVYLVEADDANEANERVLAETDAYFNGVEDESDCECCGDRWYPAWEDKEGTDTPTYYGEPVVEVEEPVVFGMFDKKMLVMGKNRKYYAVPFSAASEVLNH